MQLEATLQEHREVIVTAIPPHDPNYARLDQRVTGLEQLMKDINAGIGDLAKKFDERGKTPWPVLLTAGGIMITLVGLIGTSWKAPIDAMLIRQEQDIRQVRADQVPRVEIDNLRELTGRERDDMKGRLDRLEDFMFSKGGL